MNASQVEGSAEGRRDCAIGDGRPSPRVEAEGCQPVDVPEHDRERVTALCERPEGQEGETVSGQGGGGTGQKGKWARIILPLFLFRFSKGSYPMMVWIRRYSQIQRFTATRTSSLRVWMRSNGYEVWVHRVVGYG